MKILILFSLLIFITACSDEKSEANVEPEQTSTSKVERSFDFAQLTHGGQLFQQNCAECHGAEAQGTANWQQPDADGKYPPPPLNGTAHAWHHSKDVLKDTIKKGTIRIGGNMPPWQDKLSDKDIEDIIAWFQSKWSDEIYTVWYKSHQSAQQ